jgi:hypothetical protein
VWIWALLSDTLRTRWTLIVAQGKSSVHVIHGYLAIWCSVRLHVRLI